MSKFATAVEPPLGVVFVADWKELGHKSPASHWFVLNTFADNPQQRWLAVYANLMGKTSLFRAIAGTSIQTIISGIDKGLPTGTLDKVKDLIGVNRAALSRLLDVSPRTISRRQTLKPTVSERLFRISAVFHQALEVLGERDEARHWFTTPKKALGGKTPFEFAETEVGAREVEDLLGRLEHGVYS